MSKCIECKNKDNGFNCLHHCHGGDAFVPKHEERQHVIIELPVELINRLYHGGEKSIHDYSTIMKAIMNGIPLPEGHGRLIDADMFLSRNAYFADKDFIDSKYGDTLKDLIDNSPTIIEADMELKDTCIENGDLEVIGAIEVYDDLIEQLLVHVDAIDFANQKLREKLDKLKVEA